MRRNPDIGLSELFSKLRLSAAYTRHPISLYRWLKTNCYYGIIKIKQTLYKPKPYKTPELLGEKWELLVASFIEKTSCPRSTHFYIKKQIKKKTNKNL